MNGEKQETQVANSWRIIIEFQLDSGFRLEKQAMWTVTVQQSLFNSHCSTVCSSNTMSDARQKALCRPRTSLLNIHEGCEWVLELVKKPTEASTCSPFDSNSFVFDKRILEEWKMKKIEHISRRESLENSDKQRLRAIGHNRMERSFLCEQQPFETISQTVVTRQCLDTVKSSSVETSESEKKDLPISSLPVSFYSGKKQFRVQTIRT